MRQPYVLYQTISVKFSDGVKLGWSVRPVVLRTPLRRGFLWV